VTERTPTPNPAPTLHGERVTLRPTRPDDLERLREILLEPSVSRWWGGPRDDPDFDVAVDWLDGDETDTKFIIELDGVTVGSIQTAEELEPDYRHAGIDLFLTSAAQGQGLGTDAIRTVARWLFEVRGHHRITIDPSAANERAIRAYQRVGFRPVGIQRQYERGPDGTWHDGLLLDLLKGELR
jgi:aminoglycoside 6'-N-acetyltransferase